MVDFFMLGVGRGKKLDLLLALHTYVRTYVILALIGRATLRLLDNNRRITAEVVVVETEET